MDKIFIYKHDVPELLNNEYNVYSDDGSLEISISDILISDDVKEEIKKTRKTKTPIGQLINDSGITKFEML